MGTGNGSAAQLAPSVSRRRVDTGRITISGPSTSNARPRLHPPQWRARRLPENWGGDALDALSRYDGLQAIRLTALGRYAVGLTDTYQPPVGGKDTQGLKVLRDLDIVATGALSAADQLVLSGYAEHTADRAWTVSAASLLAAIITGRDPSDFATFLAQRTDHELPDSLGILISDVTRRCAQLTDLGHARVIECADRALAALIAHNRALRALCHPIDDRHLAVPLAHELKFRTALLKLGYALPEQPTF